jgi:hypothetical protein
MGSQNVKGVRLVNSSPKRSENITGNRIRSKAKQIMLSFEFGHRKQLMCCTQQFLRLLAQNRASNGSKCMMDKNTTKEI